MTQQIQKSCRNSPKWRWTQVRILRPMLSHTRPSARLSRLTRNVDRSRSNPCLVMADGGQQAFAGAGSTGAHRAPIQEEVSISSGGRNGESWARTDGGHISSTSCGCGNTASSCGRGDWPTRDGSVRNNFQATRGRGGASANPSPQVHQGEGQDPGIWALWRPCGTAMGSGP